MSAGKHGSSEITVTYDSTPGGSGVAIQNHILQMGGLKIESIQQLSDALGDAWEESSPTGKRRVPPIDLEGFFDDTATTGPHTVLRVTDDDTDPNGSTRTLVVVCSNTSKTFTVETRLAEYEVLAQNGNLTRFKAKIVPTGVAAWS
jgi:hypothetical protein